MKGTSLFSLVSDIITGGKHQSIIKHVARHIQAGFIVKITNPLIQLFSSQVIKQNTRILDGLFEGHPWDKGKLWHFFWEMGRGVLSLKPNMRNVQGRNLQRPKVTAGWALLFSEQKKFIGSMFHRNGMYVYSWCVF